MSVTMVGRQVGRYLLSQELGRGGMGVVYRATQVTLNRTVAIKMLPPHLATSREYLARFRREAETLSRLSHEHIVHIYDVDEIEGSHFIVMEFVDGPSLTSVLARRGRLPAACARDVTTAIASALTVAHRQGIVHRDIKPDNILVSSAGQPKLTDFGIAHMRDGRLQTQAGTLLGTPYYMSPEQATGREISAATDVYSLAVVLYEMLSGRVPFDAEDPLALALKHVQEEPPPLKQIAPQVPDALAREVHRALRKDPRERHASAQEFRDRLAAIDLGLGHGQSLAVELATRPQGEGTECPECATPIDDEFLTCPHCGLAIRHRCSSCGRLNDALSQACPACRSPATPPELRAPAVVVAARTSERPIAAPGAEGQGAGGKGQERGAPATPAQTIATTAESAIPSPEPTAQPTPPAGRSRARVAAAGAVAAAVANRAVDEVRRGGEDLAEAVRRIRNPNAPPPTQRQFVVTGIAVALLVAAVLMVWRPWKMPSPAISVLPPPGNVGTRQQFEPPVSSPTARPNPPAATPTVDPGARTTTTPTPVPISTPDSTESARGAARGGRSAAPVDPGANPSSGGSAGAAGGTTASGGRADPNPAAGFDRESPEYIAARRSIEAIIERQRQATEDGDADSLIADLSDDLKSRSIQQLRDLHRNARDVASRVSSVKLDFLTWTQVAVTFHARVTAIRRSDSRPVTVYDGPVEWRVDRVGPRWRITRTSGA